VNERRPVANSTEARLSGRLSDHGFRLWCNDQQEDRATPRFSRVAAVHACLQI